MNRRVLLVDDEPDILAPVQYALERDGFAVEVALDGEQGLELARRGHFDVVVLDVMMPRASGLDVCRELRNESDVPIIMLTARDDEVDRVLGLELGADDYVTKPFSTAELISRVRSILRRRQLDRASGGATREAAGIRIDLDQHRVTVDDVEVSLTPSEYRLLLLFVDNPERVFTRGQIMEHLWQSPYVGDARACDAHIANLRRKVDRSGTRPERILTVRGIGYKLAAATSRRSPDGRAHP
jgi:two-component system response regulator RegX3